MAGVGCLLVGETTREGTRNEGELALLQPTMDAKCRPKFEDTPVHRFVDVDTASTPDSPKRAKPCGRVHIIHILDRRALIKSSPPIGAHRAHPPRLSPLASFVLPPVRCRKICPRPPRGRALLVFLLEDCRRCSVAAVCCELNCIDCLGLFAPSLPLITNPQQTQSWRLPIKSAKW
jgi:hypothetical protein